jgi:hypothetical protein
MCVSIRAIRSSHDGILPAVVSSWRGREQLWASSHPRRQQVHCVSEMHGDRQAPYSPHFARFAKMAGFSGRASPLTAR